MGGAGDLVGVHDLAEVVEPGVDGVEAVAEAREPGGRRGEGVAIAVDADDREVRSPAVEDRLGVAAAAERGVEHDARRHGREHVDDLVEHHGAVLERIAHPDGRCFLVTGSSSVLAPPFVSCWAAALTLIPGRPPARRGPDAATRS